MRSRTSIRPFPQAMSVSGLGLFKWERTIKGPSPYPHREVHPSGVFAGLASAAPEEAVRRNIRSEDGWKLVRA